jgi:hypothetical protein
MYCRSQLLPLHLFFYSSNYKNVNGGLLCYHPQLSAFSLKEMSHPTIVMIYKAIIIEAIKSQPFTINGHHEEIDHVL